MKNLAFTPTAFGEYNEWFEKDAHIVQRIKTLIREIDRDPFKGIGKPEPLKETGAVIGAEELIKNTASYIKLLPNKF